MPLIPQHSELKSLSDDELITRYDAAAVNTIVGTSFYLDELSRRHAVRESARMLSLTKTMRTLTWVILALTLVNVALVSMPAIQTQMCG